MKRPRRLSLGAALLALSAAAPSAVFANLPGDVNGDGVVDERDAQALANYVVGNSTYVAHPENADVNGDGVVNAADVLLILQLARGLRTGFVYEPTRAVAVAPSSGTTAAALGAEVSAIFSNPISTASLPGNFTLVDVQTGQVSTGTFRCSENGTTVIFTPSAPLQAASAYAVYLSTGILDRFGHPLSAGTASYFATAPPGTLTWTSVSGSTAALSALTAAPISVRLLTSTGAAAASVPVVFTAQLGNGLFEPSGLRQVTVLSDVSGVASTGYLTGTQAMANTIAVYAAGFSAPAPLQILTMPTAAVNLRLYTGGNQTGATGGAAPLPLVVQATDAGGDYVLGTTVTFTVPAGQGSFAGAVSSSVVTDSTGTAAATFSFGASSGMVTVTASFPGMLGMAPTFLMNALTATASTSTYISGNVIDSKTLLPLTSVYVYLTDNPSIWDRSDQNGNFILPVSTGPHVVEVDGFESGLIGGQMYPTVSYPVDAVQGQTTGLGIPAMLPQLEQQSYIDVSDVVGGTLTMRSHPQWQIYVAPGQATFQNGSHTGRLYASFVSHDKIPMPVAGGKSSRFDDTIQPPTVTFNPPVQTTFPNLDGLSPGTVTEIFTLDYVSGSFKRTGRALVSADGSVIQSLPGEGIAAGGWHLVPGPTPPPAGCVQGSPAQDGGNCAQVYAIGPGGHSVPCSPPATPGGKWSCLVCGLDSNTNPATIAVACGLPLGSTPPLAGPGNGGAPPPTNGPPNSQPCSSGPPNVTGINIAPLAATVPVGGVQTFSVYLLTDPPGTCVSNVPVTISAVPDLVAVAGGQGGGQVNIPTGPLGTTIDVMGNTPGQTQLTASAGAAQSAPVSITVSSAPTVQISNVDVTQNSIMLTLSPQGVTGVLTLQITGPAGNVDTLETVTRTGGTYNENFDDPSDRPQLGALNAGFYSQVVAQWSVNGITASLPFRTS